MIKTMLVDLGKTILDNAFFDFEKGYQAVYNATSRTVSYEEYRRVERIIYSLTYRKAKLTNTEVRLTEYIETILKICNLQTTNTMLELESIFLDNLTEKEGLMKGALKLLKILEEMNIMVIAVSNSSISSISLQKELNRLGVNSLRMIISSADVLFRKPDIRIFEEAIKTVQRLDNTVSLDEIYFLGNDYYCDIIGANNAKLKTIWYNPNKEDDYLNIADINIQDYDELIKIIRGKE